MTSPANTTSTPGSAPLRLDVAGMSCGGCVAAVERALASVPGVRVQHVAVGAASVELEPGTPSGAVLAAVRDAGYEASLADDAARPAGAACCAPRTA